MPAEPGRVSICPVCGAVYRYVEVEGGDGEVQPMVVEEPVYPGRKVRLLTRADRRNLPDLYAQDGAGLDAVAWVKWFTPDSNRTWYVSEYDGADLCFGLAIGHAAELGYFSMAEVAALRGPMGLLVERDHYFKPCPLRELVPSESEGARGER